MNFDVKDVKSWANRKDVKIGAEGYFCHDINKLRNNENEYIKPVKSKLSAIRDNYATCFQIDNGRDGDNVFPFFLPLDKVKKEYTCDFNALPLDDVKYRACKDIRDVMKLLDKEEHGNNLVGTIIHIRHKITETTETAMITNVQRRSDGEYHLIFGNAGYTLNDLFDCIDILINGKYQPFGVEVKDD